MKSSSKSSSNILIMKRIRTRKEVITLLKISEHPTRGKKHPVNIFVPRHRLYSIAIWTSFYQFWAHVIWAPKLKICTHMCGRKI